MKKAIVWAAWMLLLVQFPVNAIDRETASYLAAQVINYDDCMDAYSVRHASANASPTEIGLAASEECKVYHLQLLDAAEVMINQNIPDAEDPSEQLTIEQARMSVFAQYFETVKEQKRNALSRSLNLIVKERSNN